MKSQEIHSNNAPTPVGAYSQAVRSGNLVFCAGQIGIDPKNGKLVTGGIEDETRQAMENIKAILSSAGTGFGNVIRMDVYLTDINDWQKVNDIYAKYFGDGIKPARQSVCISALPKNAKIEITCIASLD